jgi:hypothetical protein
MAESSVVEGARGGEWGTGLKCEEDGEDKRPLARLIGSVRVHGLPRRVGVCHKGSTFEEDGVLAQDALKYGLERHERLAESGGYGRGQILHEGVRKLCQQAFRKGAWQVGSRERAESAEGAQA